MQTGVDGGFHYGGRRFRVLSNSANGDAQASTEFEYHQSGNLVWATYQGGDVACGTLIAIVGEGGVLDMRYQHVNRAGEFRSGKCRSVPEGLSGGRLRLHESWQWTDGDQTSGTSVIEEIG